MLKLKLIRDLTAISTVKYSCKFSSRMALRICQPSLPWKRNYANFSHLYNKKSLSVSNISSFRSCIRRGSNRAASTEQKEFKPNESNQDEQDSRRSSNWFAIPISVGVVYIGLMQLYKVLMEYFVHLNLDFKTT